MTNTHAKSILDSIITDGGITLAWEQAIEFFSLLRESGKRVEGIEDCSIVECAIVAFGKKGKHIIARPSTVGGDEFYGYPPRKVFKVSYEAI